MSKLTILIVFVSLMGVTLGVCIWPWGAGVINVCKQTGKVDCQGVSSASTCKNLIGGPFVSGFSGGSYSCTIYSGSSCTGTTVSVDRAGWSKFPITPNSVKCPCV